MAQELFNDVSLTIQLPSELRQLIKQAVAKSSMKQNEWILAELRKILKSKEAK